MEADESEKLLAAHDGPELFFGLVCPTGTETAGVVDALTAALARVGYTTEQISLSNLIDSVTGKKTALLHEDERIRHLMKAGTKLCDDSGRGDFIALLAIAAIRQIRTEKHRLKKPELKEAEAANLPLNRTAYVLKSLKREQEAQTL
ncbi:MAG: hypothetical protein EPO20_00745 [Betaproteobacteria bacterium]|nr:MAG: hypothetical protein EPO20_00745 [Betaproteobacteria bacterium]